MPSTNAKCPVCTATLEVESDLEAAVCPHCGSAYVVKKAIESYNAAVSGGKAVESSPEDFVIRDGVLEYYTGSAESVVIPRSVKRIGAQAFEGCKSIVGVVIPNGVTRIGAQAFDGCSALSSVSLPSGLVDLGAGAFSHCASLTSIELPSGVKKLGMSAFSHSALTTLELPAGVETIGAKAFAHCASLCSVKLSEGLVEVLHGAFLGCTSLAEIALPNGIKKLDDQAFLDCTSLKSVRLPSDLAELGSAVFRNCTSLAEIALPSSLTKIGAQAFSGCSELSCVAIPGSVTSIGDVAFALCSKLRSVSCPASAAVADNAFFGTPWDRAQKNRPKEEVPQSEKKRCYVVSSVYGSEDCPEVWTLRRYRDDRLSKTFFGRAFISTYHRLSPGLVRRFGKTSWFNSFFRRMLDRKVRRLNKAGFSPTPYDGD